MSELPVSNKEKLLAFVTAHGTKELREPDHLRKETFEQFERYCLRFKHLFHLENKSLTDQYHSICFLSTGEAIQKKETNIAHKIIPSEEGNSFEMQFSIGYINQLTEKQAGGILNILEPLVARETILRNDMAKCQSLVGKETKPQYIRDEEGKLRIAIPIQAGDIKPFFDPIHDLAKALNRVERREIFRQQPYYGGICLTIAPDDLVRSDTLKSLQIDTKPRECVQEIRRLNGSSIHAAFDSAIRGHWETKVSGKSDATEPKR